MNKINELENLINKAVNLINDIEDESFIKLTDEQKEKLSYIYSNIDHIGCTIEFLIN